MRPKKTRWINCVPGERCFKPLCKPLSASETVYVTLDEFEAVRLACLEGLEQVDAAKLMRISRPTFSRMLTSAQKKIADGLVNIKAIRIEGGCCKIKVHHRKGGKYGKKK
ncbi:MAG: DUF134 domain-containing protein [Candidatus Omnitrophica bacterium]|nr:DUF134 domain-containing protein [Candidatus Omnitrophota bacterium]